MKKIGILGSIAIDNIFIANSIPSKGERVYGKLLSRNIGGMGANQAVEAARYVDNVYILGKVGDDSNGKELESYFLSRNIKTDYLSSGKNESTGQTYMYFVEKSGDYFSIVTPGTNMTISSDTIVKNLKGIIGGVLLLSLEINPQVVLSALTYAKENGIYTYLVPSPAESCDPKYIEMTDALILNQREAQILLGIVNESVENLKKELLELNTRHDLILLTLGSEGALLKEQGQVYYAPAYPVEVIDTVGAGDALSGAFVSARLLGMSPYKALAFGCIAGSLTVSLSGAQSSTHTFKQVEQYYEKYYKKKEWRDSI